MIKNVINVLKKYNVGVLSALLVIGGLFIFTSVYAAGGLRVDVARQHNMGALEGAEVDIRCVNNGVAGSWRNIGTTDEDGNVTINGTTLSTRLNQSSAGCGDTDTVDIMVYADGYVTNTASSTLTISGDRSTWANNTLHDVDFAGEGSMEYSHLLYITDEWGNPLSYVDDVLANEQECDPSPTDNGYYLCAVAALGGLDVDIESGDEYDYFASSTTMAGRSAATDPQVTGGMILFYKDRGCMDPGAENYDPSADVDDYCEYFNIDINNPWWGEDVEEWNPSVDWDGADEGTCEYSFDNSSWASTTCSLGGSDIAAPESGEVTLYVRAERYNAYFDDNETDGDSVSFDFNFLEAPTVVTGSSTGVTDSYAEIAYTVTDVGSANVNEYGIEYATDGYYDEYSSYNENVNMSEVDVSPSIGGGFNLYGLSCGTTYHYRAYAINNDGQTGYGSDETFTTAECPDEPYSFPGGDGTGDTPYQIASCEDLEAVELDMSANYILIDDVTCSDVILGDFDHPFTGIFDGDDFTITNTVSTTSDYVGLFAHTQGASVSQLVLSGSYVSSGFVVGSLVGYAENTTLNDIQGYDLEVEGTGQAGGFIGEANVVEIEDAHFDGSVVSHDEDAGGLVGYGEYLNLYFVSAEGEVTGVQNVGGLAGSIYNSEDSDYSVSESYASAEVIGEVDVGGLFGDVSGVSQIENVYAAVEGSVSGYQNVGGLIGTMEDSSVYSSYSANEVDGTGFAEDVANENIGGFVGNSWNSVISDSFAASDMNFLSGYDEGDNPLYEDRDIDGVYIGSFVGKYGILLSGDMGEFFNNNYYDIEAADQTACYGYAFDDAEGSFALGDCNGVNGMDTEPDYFFFNTSNDPLDTWDFDDIWETEEGEYPRLLMGEEDDDADEEGGEPYDYEDGDGSEENPYEIDSCEALRGIEDYIFTYFELTDDLDCEDWEPIYSNVTDDGQSIIALDGNGYTINYTIEAEEPGNYGLFTWLDGGYVFDLNLTGSITFGYGNAGGVAGMVTGGGEISRVHSSVNITGDGNIGGLAGVAEDFEIYDSYVTADFQGSSSVGGLVGLSDGDNNFNRNYYVGNITGLYVGGLVGESSLDADEPSEYNDNFVDGSISESDAGAYGAALVGLAREDDDFSNNWYGTETTGYTNCKNLESGEGPDHVSDVEGECSGTSELGFFEENNENPPLDTWDFGDIWEVTDTYPSLRFSEFGEDDGDEGNDLLVDLIGYWELDEDTGSLREDSFGSNDLTDANENVVGVDDGFIDQAAEFSATNEYLIHGDNSDLSTGEGTSFAISLWVRLNEIEGTQVFVSKFDSVNTGEYAVYAEDGVFKFATYTGGTGYPVDAYEGEVGEWYHIVAMHDAEAGTNSIKVNNAADNVISSVPDHADSNGDFIIGAFGPSRTYSALAEIDEVGFWKRTLTSDEIDELYDGGDGMSFGAFGDGEDDEEEEDPSVSIENPAGVDGSYVEILGFLAPNGHTMTERGFEISEEEDMSGENIFLTETTEDEFGDNTFLMGETFDCGTYYYRAYAVDSDEEYYYSNVLSFTVSDGCEEEEEEETPTPPRRGGGSSGGRSPAQSSANTAPAGTNPVVGGGSAGTRNLTTGDSGNDVKELQKFLNTHGFPVAPSGPGSLGNETDLFGGLTRDALAKFQAANGLSPAAGYYGPLTQALVASMLGGGAVLPAPAAPVVATPAPEGVRDLESGMSGEDVRKLQAILIEQGYPIPAGATGLFGSQTKSALMAYQAAKGLPSTGFFGPQTRAQMKSAGIVGIWW